MVETDANSLLDQEQVCEAVGLLLKGSGGKKKRKKSLFGAEQDDVLLQISAIRIPPRTQVLKFVVPHSVWKEGSDVCLFVKDLKKGLFEDHTPTVLYFQEMLAAKGVKRVNQVISLRQLKSEFKQYEAKRRLSNQFQVFLADSRIMCYLPSLLGKAFYDRKKLPIQVDLRKADLVGEVERALSTTQLPLLNHGPCSSMQVGNLGQGAQELVQNIAVVLKALADKFPGGFNNVRSIYLKARSSGLALPVYVSAASGSAVRNVGGKVKKEKWVEDELSTVPGAKVRVYPDGRVVVIKEKKGKRVDQEDVEEEKGRSEEKRTEEKVAEESQTEEVDMAEEAYLRKWVGTREEEITRDKQEKSQAEKDVSSPEVKSKQSGKKTRKRTKSKS